MALLSFSENGIVCVLTTLVVNQMWNFDFNAFISGCAQWVPPSLEGTISQLNAGAGELSKQTPRRLHRWLYWLQGQKRVGNKAIMWPIGLIMIKCCRDDTQVHQRIFGYSPNCANCFYQQELATISMRESSKVHSSVLWWYCMCYNSPHIIDCDREHNVRH